MKVYGIQCPVCEDIVFSRARHDFRFCSCGETGIDGGFDYTKVAFNPVYGNPKDVQLDVDADKNALYNDWNSEENKYGLIPGKLEDEE